MIKLFDDWSIVVDEMCYALVYDTGRTQKDKRNGKTRPVYKNYGYYSSLESALKAFAKTLNRLEFKDNDMTLDEAISKIQETNQMVGDLIKKHAGEV